VTVAWCLGGLLAGATLVAFCVQHDANHGSYFKSRRYNHLVGWTADALLGFSSYAWRVKHNVAHHTYTNVDGYDDDIEKTPFADSRRFSRGDRGTDSSICTCGPCTR
jgi:Fatty acid desaturase